MLSLSFPRCRWALATLLSCCWLETAAAADAPWHLITVDPAASTSGCIGAPTTPLCAVETLLACFQRSDAALCRQVDGDVDQYAQIFDEPADPGKYLAYRVVETSGEADPSTLEAVVVIEQKEIALGRSIDAEAGSTSRFKVKRRPDGSWRIDSWDDLND